MVLNLIMSIIAGISFIITLWQLMRGAEYVNAMRHIHTMASQHRGEIEKSAVVYLRSIQIVTATYLKKKEKSVIESLLIEKKILLTKLDIEAFESDSQTKIVWLVTPDLEPDLTYEDTGRLVSQNLSRNVSYVYFYNSSLKDVEIKKSKLLRNIGGVNGKEKFVEFVGIDDNEMNSYFPRHMNIIFVHFDDNYDKIKCFEELYLSAVDERASFWQEHKFKIYDEWHKYLSSKRKSSTVFVKSVSNGSIE